MWDIDDLIRREREYQDSIQPVDVEVVLGDEILTVRIPYLHDEAFKNFLASHPVPRNPLGTQFDLNAVMRDHPEIVLVDGDEVDEMFVLKGKKAHYRWPELYDALSDNDKENLQAVIWGFHVHEPRQRLAAASAAAKAARAEKKEEVGDE